MSKFNVGDVVRMKGQEVVMTVVGIGPEKQIVVVWFDGNTINKLECLDWDCFEKIGDPNNRIK